MLNVPPSLMPIGYHSLYCDGLSPDAKFPRERYPKLRQAIDERKVTEHVHWFHPRKATVDELSDIHDVGYILRFLSGTLSPKEKRQIGLRPWTDNIVERTLRLTGGTVQCVENVLKTGGYAGNLAGGTHHAFRQHGSGYCIFNDIAIGAMTAIGLGAERISVIDLDVHQGDGTASICQQISAIQTISVHCERNFPFRKQQSDLDIPLQEKASDTAYLTAVEIAIEASRSFRPNLVIYQGGVDPLQTDRLGRLNVTRQGLATRNQMVFDYVDAHNLPCVVLMGGGYSVPIEDTVDCLADMFTEAALRHNNRIRNQHAVHSI
jgi:acetoin utilization deacetylase AcuC-like enzyme